MSILFLFGSGASYGSLDCIPYPPPLATGLFDELQKAGGISSTIGGQLADLFQQDFEAGMDQFFQEHNEDVIGFLREMAHYFAQFQPGLKNQYTRLIKSLMSVNDKVIFSTTNYELLIEMAASHAGLGVRYYCPLLPTKDFLPVLKIHGSCNFLPAIGGKLKDVKFKMASTKGTAIEAPVRIADSLQQIIHFCETEDSAAPAIAMFAPSKWVPICRQFVEQQQKQWQDEVYRASNIFVIGAGVHERDTHIWMPLEKSLGFLTYVDPNPEQFLTWAKNRNRALVDVIPLSFEDAIPLIERSISRY
jgi:hypothetical protein